MRGTSSQERPPQYHPPTVVAATAGERESNTLARTNCAYKFALHVCPCQSRAEWQSDEGCRARGGVLLQPRSGPANHVGKARRTRTADPGASPSGVPCPRSIRHRPPLDGGELKIYLSGGWRTTGSRWARRVKVFSDNRAALMGNCMMANERQFLS